MAENLALGDTLSAQEEKDRQKEVHRKIVTGTLSTDTAEIHKQQASQKFSKPQKYTGTRKYIDDKDAKNKIKKAKFAEGKTVKDPYTGDTLVLTQQEAKLLYGDEWTKHSAEADHTVPVKKVYEESADNPWVTTEDIRSVVNSEKNLKAISRKTNNAKRDRTNKEFVEDEPYRESKGVVFTDEGAQAAIEDGKSAELAIKRNLKKATVKGFAKTGHEAGVAGAKNAGTMVAAMSGIRNITAVLKGEKDVQEAISDTAKDAGKAAVTGYTMSGGLTVISHSLSDSSSKFIQALVKSNVPGKVITAVMATGGTLKRYANGELTTQECLIELGEAGLNTLTAGYSMAVGQALIPIPVIGAAIGALVGSALTSGCYHKLIETLQTPQLEHEERLRIIRECNELAEQTKLYRLELETYLNDYFKAYHDCFDDAISVMKFSFQCGDADSIIAEANAITEQNGGHVEYRTVEEFKKFFDNTKLDKI